jgi:hypothetical protein
MKRFILATAIVLLMFGMASAKDFTARVTIGNWNGLDGNGAMEGSLPVTIKVCDSTTNAVLSQTTANGAVTNLVMPTFIVAVPDNTTKKLKVYATVTDSLGNASAKSPDSNEVTLVGNDTSAPAGINSITITIE